ncbi:UDP-N-acetylmuramate dehydrogenase [Tomitella biformata]|uniref:UDP-N-acetylmuramate dehydrogenase n=1 Tax=Tomitella biformata TaxID=630403 RepID=UPI00057156DB|nr:UDP-N-acetylmuramate dehydrogenase [Tomitella biformata]
MDVSKLASDAGADHAVDAPLSGLTTLHLGGPARHLITCATTTSLVQVIAALDAAEERALIVAGGSNLVISDEGFDGVVVCVANAEVAVEGSVLTAEAGAEWDHVVATAVTHGLGGIECLSGIPGSAGATPVQNVGAYGVEVAEVLRRVELLDRVTGEVRWAAPSELGLAYRSSVLKHSDDALVLRVELDLTADGLSAPVRYRELTAALGAAEGDRLPVAQVRETVLALRAGKGMVLGLTDADGGPDHDTWSAGSFFTNPIVAESALPGILAAIAARVGVDVRAPQFPDGEGRVKLSAGWLIERAGFAKGHPGASAAARLSTKHTLALTNRGAATTADLLALAREVRAGVHAAFGVTLTPEPVLVGCAI